MRRASISTRSRRRRGERTRPSEEIAARTGREVSRPAVYIALRRLEAKGLLTSRLGDATAERGGRAKRYFRITKAGARQLEDARVAFTRMWRDVEHLARRSAK